MQALKENYDRVLTVVFGLIALAVGAMLSLKALALPDKYVRADAPENANYGASGLAVIEDATAHLGKDTKWASPTMPGVPQKALPLFQLPPVWVQGGDEIDLLDPNSPQIRPPLDNSYVHEFNLPAGRSDLLRLDLDGDGFNTLEEFENGKTNPVDKNSFPALSLKLQLAEIKSDVWELDFRTPGGDTGDQTIREETKLFRGESPRRKTHYVKVGGIFGQHPGHKDRYKLVKYEAKQRKEGPFLKPADELTIEDLQNPGETFKLILKDPHIEATHYAVFHYSLAGHEGNLDGFYKVGDTFELPNDPDSTYEVIELTGNLADGAKIRKKGAAGEPPMDLSISPMLPGGPAPVTPGTDPAADPTTPPADPAAEPVAPTEATAPSEEPGDPAE